MARPNISVVVPVRDGAASLSLLFESLAAQTMGADRFEVVVVDNGSRDTAAAEVAGRAGAIVVRVPWANRALARNRGVEAAAAELIAFTDGDCRAAPAWLEALAGCLERAPLVAGPVRLDTADPPGRIERLELLWRFAQEENVRDHGWAASANLGVRRTAYESIGGFDGDYRQIGEDVDLCLRAGAAGHRLAYCADAVIHHEAETALGPVLRRAFRHGFSSTQHHRRLAMAVGWRYWLHPRPVLVGDWALRRFGEGALAEPDLMPLARAEYAARVAGSAWAELRRMR
ncbi:MAG: glycosyltransferase family 2 protein [Solirubrobacteraceae bacterium]